MATHGNTAVRNRAQHLLRRNHQEEFMGIYMAMDRSDRQAQRRSYGQAERALARIHPEEYRQLREHVRVVHDLPRKKPGRPNGAVRRRNDPWFLDERDCWILLERGHSLFEMSRMLHKPQKSIASVLVPELWRKGYDYPKIMEALQTEQKQVVARALGESRQEAA